MTQISSGRVFFLSLLFSLLFVSFVKAQTPTFFFDTETVDPGTTVNIDVKVTSFQDILGMQFSVNWDPTVLNFVTAENFGLVGISLVGNFGTTMAADGKIGFLWTDPAAGGVSVDDNTVIFSIQFEVIGAADASTDLIFGSMPTPIEISNNDGVVNSNLVNTVIDVSSPDGVYNTAPDKIEVKECFPNPFIQNTQLNFTLVKRTQLSLSILDQSGRIIYNQTEVYAEGQNKIILNSDLFPAAGVYYYELLSSEFKVSQKVVFIK